jgi:hypothetical protein
MLPKFYPVILVVNDESGLHFKMVHNPEAYNAFCSEFVGPDTALQTIKTLEAWYREKIGDWGNWNYINEKVRK